MFNKKMKIWLAFSLISILLLLLMKSKPMNIVSTFLVKNDAYFHQVANEYSVKRFSTIEKRVDAYPEYQKCFDNSKSIDSLYKISLTNIEKVDLKAQRDYIKCNLLHLTYSGNIEEELKMISQNIYYFPTEKSRQRQLQNWSFNLSKSTMLQRNRIALLNFYENQTGGSHDWFDSAEPIIINPSINALIGEKSEFKIGMSKRDIYLKPVKIWINGETLQTKDGKVFYRKRVTKSGWNTLNIKYQGEYQNQIFADSLTYRYFVCD